jgi:helicase MOV-10
MHQALCQRTRNWEILFPIWSTRLRPASAAYVLNLETFDPLIMNNRAQKEAVASILTRSHGDLPFVIFGPPGILPFVSSERQRQYTLKKLLAGNS